MTTSLFLMAFLGASNFLNLEDTLRKHTLGGALFQKFTFLSSTYNLISHNLLGTGYIIWIRFLVNLMCHLVEESLPHKVKVKLPSTAVKVLCDLTSVDLTHKTWLFLT